MPANGKLRIRYRQGALAAAVEAMAGSLQLAEGQEIELRQEDGRIVVVPLCAKPDEAAVAADWANELELRSREMAEGQGQAVEWGVVHAGILAELDDGRASRSSF